MKRHFSAMNAQQAPAPRQARLLGADQTASTKAQRMTGGTVTANSATATTVRIVLETLLKRLARSQPNRPAPAGGCGSTASGSSCVTSVIAQRSARVKLARDPIEKPLSALQGGEGGARRAAAGRGGAGRRPPA